MELFEVVVRKRPMLAKIFQPKTKKINLPNALPASENGKPFIQMNKIVKTFKNAAGEFEVLKGIDVNFFRGEFVGVIGKSGSGKSTLINMLTGIDRPTSGEIFVGNLPVHQLSENEMAIWRGKNLGIVFQFFQLLPTLSLVENIMLPMDFCDMYAPNERKERAMELLHMVEMEDDADKLPSAISGGQQQRVAIARALANDPPILVADEPTGNLDSKTADAIFSMFADLVKGGKTIVMVTHDSALARRVSRTVLLADGEIVNEWVARALPTLSHNQMLNVSHQVEPMHFEPGLVIINEGEKNSQFFIVTKGNVEVVLQASGGMDVVVAQMTPGQYVGEIELFRDESAIATVRAGIKGTELIALNRDEFFRLISESESTKDAFHQIVEQRKKENIAARKGYH